MLKFAAHRDSLSDRPNDEQPSKDRRRPNDARSAGTSRARRLRSRFNTRHMLRPTLVLEIIYLEAIKGSGTNV